MTSKEALDKLYMACDSDLLYEQSGIISANELTTIIEQDLDLLEELEDNIKIHKETIKMQHAQIEKLIKVIGILKGRICVHQKYICYGGFADIKLTDEEIKLVKEYL